VRSAESGIHLATLGRAPSNDGDAGSVAHHLRQVHLRQHHRIRRHQHRIRSKLLQRQPELLEETGMLGKKGGLGCGKFDWLQRSPVCLDQLPHFKDNATPVPERGADCIRRTHLNLRRSSGAIP